MAGDAAEATPGAEVGCSHKVLCQRINPCPNYCNVGADTECYVITRDLPGATY